MKELKESLWFLVELERLMREKTRAWIAEYWASLHYREWLEIYSPQLTSEFSKYPAITRELAIYPPITNLAMLTSD
jgi:hypothetical protein